ncbi:hypothetical protein [Fodinicola acaciae]|uniref:hypothetical protein n=1 Tax=Fodinicola acaciae TaxID=2681555 RepID=UPI0013D38C1B|nr:hypothetical protein [Fodinicola acaciae]
MFKAAQIDTLAASGWSACGSVARLVAAAGLPAITRDYLADAFTAEQWKSAQERARALSARFAGARFADEVTYGVLLVPDPALLDTRRALPADVRTDQLGQPSPDVFDERLPDGVLGVSGAPWTMVVTVTGAYGPALGSWRQVTESDDLAVDGVDTRPLMIRQLWGARVLQCGAAPPDCEANQRWTFTLFAGEPLTDGLAESGTVLKGRVRFRLGKPDRGIGSARVAPAL